MLYTPLQMSISSTLGPGDKQKIKDIILAYDKIYPSGPDSIAMAVVSAQQEQYELRLSGGIGKHGIVKGSESDRRLSVTLPSKLYIILRKQYPDLITKNVRWFRRNFPMFIVEK